MGMKPRLNDSPGIIPGTVNQASKVSEFANIPGTVSQLKVVEDNPIPGVVDQMHNPNPGKTPAGK